MIPGLLKSRTLPEQSRAAFSYTNIFETTHLNISKPYVMQSNSTKSKNSGLLTNTSQLTKKPNFSMRAKIFMSFLVAVAMSLTGINSANAQLVTRVAPAGVFLTIQGAHDDALTVNGA